LFFKHDGMSSTKFIRYANYEFLKQKPNDATGFCEPEMKVDSHSLKKMEQKEKKDNGKDVFITCLIKKGFVRANVGIVQSCIH